MKRTERAPWARDEFLAFMAVEGLAIRERLLGYLQQGEATVPTNWQELISASSSVLIAIADYSSLSHPTQRQRLDLIEEVCSCMNLYPEY
jgi:hypothetical protein